jgi:hypothetical protein
MQFNESLSTSRVLKNRIPSALIIAFLLMQVSAVAQDNSSGFRLRLGEVPEIAKFDSVTARAGRQPVAASLHCDFDDRSGLFFDELRMLDDKRLVVGDAIEDGFELHLAGNWLLVWRRNQHQ